MNLYVGNLPYSATESEIREKFAAIGEVVSVNLITDKFTGQARGFGFVEMADKNAGIKAISELNNQDFNGRNLVVNEAREKQRDSRPPRQNRDQDRW